MYFVFKMCGPQQNIYSIYFKEKISVSKVFTEQELDICFYQGLNRWNLFGLLSPTSFIILHVHSYSEGDLGHQTVL